MIVLPNIDPDIITFGPIHIRWYGLMYVLGFAASYILTSRHPKAKMIGLKGQVLESLFLYLFFGLLIGARLGYILFYQFANLSDLLTNPLEIIAVWHGGMSFHGGLAGCAVAGWWFSMKKGIPLAAVGDCVIATAPIGLGLGRIGNFLNGELFGRPSELPWAMVFPNAGPIPRHPSQLYEALLEGAVLFAVLWSISKKGFRNGTTVALFLLFYGFFRFMLEFVREPDAHLGNVIGFLTMGQILSSLMIAGGILLLIFLNRHSGKR
jgi:phosphatidylglycerol:prolipoprotein diacylglycerol transferase